MALPRSLGSLVTFRMILTTHTKNQPTLLLFLGHTVIWVKGKGDKKERKKEQKEIIVIIREEKMEVSTKVAAGTERREQT